MAIKLLMIDTDQTFCQNVSQRLLMENYKVFMTVDEAEAKKIVYREKVDVVLLGLKGLKQRGLALLRTMKKIQPATAVILLLPAEHLSLSIEGMRLGAFDDLLIPFDMETLLARIEAANRYRKEQEQIQRSLPHKRRRGATTRITEPPESEQVVYEEKRPSGCGSSDGKKN